jgi:hypothetical protein
LPIIASGPKFSGQSNEIAMTALTESREARHIALQLEALSVLREKHGEGLQNLWRGQFGHGFDCLTKLEGTILCRQQTLESIRDWLAKAAVEIRGRGLVSTLEGER